MIQIQDLVDCKLSGNRLYPNKWVNYGTKYNPTWRLIDRSISVALILRELGIKFETGFEGKGKSSLFLEIKGSVEDIQDALQTKFFPGDKIISESIFGWKSGIYGELITSDSVFKDCKLIRKLITLKHGN